MLDASSTVVDQKNIDSTLLTWTPRAPTKKPQECPEATRIPNMDSLSHSLSIAEVAMCGNVWSGKRPNSVTGIPGH